MSSQRQLLIWVLAALAASALLAGVLLRRHQQTRRRWNAFLLGSPHSGARLFEKKGCIRCHAVNGWGSQTGPDLGLERPSHSSLNELVTAMWNCAPRMLERIKTDRIPYPFLGQEDMAHLFAFLYTSRYIDEPGDAPQGERLFQTKGCARCHAVRGSGGGVGPDLSKVGGVDTPIVWAQLMWNHAPAMEKEAQTRGIPWPKFKSGEVVDILEYLASFNNQRRLK